MRIRSITEQDLDAVVAIYNDYVRDSVITFQEQPAATEQFVVAVSNGYPWLVAERDGRVLGYAHGSRWKERLAYRLTAESSIYLHGDDCGKGYGRRLYADLLQALREQGVHTVLAGIALPNTASVALHERLGFIPVAHMPQLGYKFGRFIDVGYWQLISSPP